jgi:hypothetical protein
MLCLLLTPVHHASVSEAPFPFISALRRDRKSCFSWHAGLLFVPRHPRRRVPQGHLNSWTRFDNYNPLLGRDNSTTAYIVYEDDRVYPEAVVSYRLSAKGERACGADVTPPPPLQHY